MLRKLLYIAIIPLMCINSLQAISQYWLVKSFVIDDGTVWRKYVLKYNAQKQVVQVRTWTSEDNSEWQYESNTLLGYDKNSQLVSQRQYTMQSDVDSILSSTYSIDYSTPDAFYKSEYSTAASDTVFSETKHFQVSDSVIYSSCWTVDGTAQASQQAVYHYDGSTLTHLDYIYTDHLDTILHYRLLFSDVSERESHTILRTYSDTDGWRDSLCSKTFSDAAGHILTCVRYRYSDTTLIPLLKANFDYDENGYLRSRLLQTWQGEFWQFLDRCIFNKTDTGTIIDADHFRYDNREWLRHYSSDFTYNAQGQVESVKNNLDFWADNDMEAVQYIPLSENLTGHYIRAAEAGFTYVLEDGTPTDTTSNSSHPFLVYPNPSTTGLFRIDGGLAPDARYYVYNSNGNMLLSGTLTNNLLDLRHLQSGLYIALVYSDGSKYSAKLMIAK